MNDLLSSILGGVGAVGEGLDRFTGGRAIRGTLAGKPRELASIIPFSDTLGLTDHADATSGRDLLDTYGLTSKGDNSFGSHAAGFLADTALSPLSWLGAGAAMKAAPTISKGLMGAGKALTGLDAFDALKAGAKGVAGHAKRFMADESGTLKLPSIHTPEMVRAILGYPRGARGAESIVDSTLDSASRGLTEYGGRDPGKSAVDFASSFWKRPNLANAPDPMVAAGDFQDAIKNGVEGALHYRGYGSNPMNDALRGYGPLGYEDELRRMIESVPRNQSQGRVGGFEAYTDNPERAIADFARLFEHSAMPKPMDLYRGIDRAGTRDLEAILGTHPSSPDAVGRSFVDPGFLSTTFDKGVSNEFASLRHGFNVGDDAPSNAGTVFHFPQVPKGKPSAFLGPGESEVVFPPGRKIRILDNANYPYVKATLYSSLLAAMAGRSYQNNQFQPGVN